MAGNAFQATTPIRSGRFVGWLMSAMSPLNPCVLAALLDFRRTQHWFPGYNVAGALAYRQPS